MNTWHLINFSFIVYFKAILLAKEEHLSQEDCLSSNFRKNRAVTECDLTPLPALWHKVVLSTETDIWTHRWMDGETYGQTDRLIPVYPENIRFEGVSKSNGKRTRYSCNVSQNYLIDVCTIQQEKMHWNKDRE